ncbi:FAD-dependent monooxygenase [Streptomyces polygonati]|uniref:FAD-dependent monooxygenase n=1 Tax=Streptomyces polygonati TaxID=1617087 RepID=A0ABV8HFL8_9ACTN
MNPDASEQSPESAGQGPAGTERTQVLVVGAGPVGLAAACRLWQYGVPARVVEAADQAHQGSRAVQLHPPTLDIFRELGVLDEAEKHGLRIRANYFHLEGGRTLRIELGSDNEPLMLPQEITCRILEERLEQLGGRVERRTQVTDVTAGADLVTVEAEGPDGPLRIEAEWLIAADGVRSRVREQLGIDFPGSPVAVNFLLAEGQVSGDFSRDAVHYFLGRAGSVVFASMPGGRTRVSAGVAPGFPLTADSVQSLLDERGPGGLRITDLDMINNFSSQERIAARLRAGRVFLVGDAAHTHSPIGGQGLNLGLQDMHNLTWKLAGVIDGVYNPAILDSYQTERLRAAEQIVRTTHQFLAVFTLGPVAARLRNALWSACEATGLLRRWFVPLLAGWRVRYPDVLAEPSPAASRYTALRNRGLTAPGARPPRWVPVSPDPSPAGFRLLTLGPSDHGRVRRGASLAGRLPDLVSHRHLPRRQGGFLLLRPDGYVAASGRAPEDLAQVESLLTRLAR